MRLIPTLEIEIPFSAGALGALPVKSGVSAIPAPPKHTRVPAVDSAAIQSWLNSWLDLAKITDSGMTVRAKNDSGDLLLYVPLALTRDPLTNDPVAFGGRIFYRPSSSGFGAAHAMRLVWTISGRQDRCTNPPPANAPEGERFNRRAWDQLSPEARVNRTYVTWANISNNERYDLWCADTANWTTFEGVMHSYRDSFYITALDVREEAGIDVALIAQRADAPLAPSAAPASRAAQHYLHTLAQGLDKTFNLGRSDLSVGEIARRFAENSPASAAQRWNLPANVFHARSFSFTDQGELGRLPAGQTQSFLNAHFVAPSGAARIGYSPLVLFVREERFRQATLDMSGSVIQRNGNRVTVNLAGLPSEKLRGINWAPFRYLGAQTWEAHPLDDYVQSLPALYKPLVAPYVQRIGGNANAADGAALVAQMLAFALIQGSSALVERNGARLIPDTPADNDLDVGALIADPSTAVSTLLSPTVNRALSRTKLAGATPAQVVNALGAQVTNAVDDDLFGLAVLVDLEDNLKIPDPPKVSDAGSRPANIETPDAGSGLLDKATIGIGAAVALLRIGSFALNKSTPDIAKVMETVAIAGDTILAVVDLIGVVKEVKSAAAAATASAQSLNSAVSAASSASKAASVVVVVAFVVQTVAASHSG